MWRGARVCRKCIAHQTAQGRVKDEITWEQEKSYALDHTGKNHSFLFKIGDGEKRGDMADACAHGNVGCARTLAESGIILWHHRLV